LSSVVVFVIINYRRIVYCYCGNVSRIT
jgi:hypothetical protein